MGRRMLFVARFSYPFNVMFCEVIPIAMLKPILKGEMLPSLFKAVLTETIGCFLEKIV